MESNIEKSNRHKLKLDNTFKYLQIIIYNYKLPVSIRSSRQCLLKINHRTNFQKHEKCQPVT